LEKTASKEVEEMTVTMFPSASMWYFKPPLADELRRVKQTAFHYVDIELEALGDSEVREALKREGLQVSCVALDHRLPKGCSLEGDDPAALRLAVDYLKAGFEQCQNAGAKVAYVLPCRNRRNLKHFHTALNELADEAAQRSIKLCVEHVPGRALSRARETLDFVSGGQNTNLYLLFDIGHALITKERAPEIIAAAGNRLGFIQLDDNDGKSDRHWPLLDGRLNVDDLQQTLRALAGIGYAGTLGLEVSNDRASVIGGLSRNRNLLLRLQANGVPKSILEPEARRKQ
jgi:sugar phosphate isomerase/epimerase